MKTKNKFIIINLVFLLFLLGCNITSSNQKTKDIDVRVGLNGLVLEFIKNTPPVKVFEGDTFPVIVKIRNNGAYTIDKDKAIISLGVEKDYTRGLKLQTTESVNKVEITQSNDKLKDQPAMFGIEGKTTINTNGGFEVVSYDLQAGNVDPQSEAHSSIVIATACYSYQTILSTTVCIDTDVSGTKPGKKVCNMQDLTFSNGQGAPVAITKIEINMLPAKISNENEITQIKPQFLIYIENKDKGNVILNGIEKEYCTQSSVGHDKLNKIWVKASLGGKELDCKTLKKDLSSQSENDNYVKLLDKKALARCIIKEENNVARNADNYLSPLRVELTYGYTQSIAANYFIQKATGQ